MYLAYCTSRGSSSPYSASICARASGVSFWSLNGEPGRSCMRNQVAVAMTTRMTKALTRRLSVYLNITHIFSPGFGRDRLPKRTPIPPGTDLHPGLPAHLFPFYARVLEVGAAAEIVRHEALEVRLLEAGDRGVVLGYQHSLVEQDRLGLQHHLHALLLVALLLRAIDKLVVPLVRPRGVV